MIIYEKVLREFQRKKVKYILVGGIAFNLLGGYRNTLDLDILVEMSDENLKKIVSILKKQNYRVKIPVDPILIADKKIRQDWIKNKNMKALNFYKGQSTYEEVDILVDSPISFKDALRNAKEVKIKNLRLPVVSLKDFIKMKKYAGRDKDLRDIKEIKALRSL